MFALYLGMGILVNAGMSPFGLLCSSFIGMAMFLLPRLAGIADGVVVVGLFVFWFGIWYLVGGAFWGADVGEYFYAVA